MRILLASVLFFIAGFSGLAADNAVFAASPWESSVVKIEVTRKQFDYYQPWNQRNNQVPKVGIVSGAREILTPAEYLSDQTLVRLQKNGRGKWWIGKIVWVDHPANLAVLTVDDDAFWTGLKPVEFSGRMPADGSLQMVRWNNGVLESSKAEFVKFEVGESQTSGISYVQFKVNVDLQGGGWGEPLVSGSHLVGIAVGKSETVCTAVPASFIRSILEAHRSGAYGGLGYFHFYWQRAENIESLKHLGLKGEARGVLVTRVPELPDGSAPVLKPRDVILQIDGFDIDIQGDYSDPEFGYLMLENLATRRKWAGDEVRLKILRDGDEMSVTYRLPKYEYTHWLVPFQSFDQEPDYFIMGGLVFQPLTCAYLRSWGNDWKRRAPFRLNYLTSAEASMERSSVLMLSQVLPDEYNIGYQEQKYLIVEKVNGRRVTKLTDLPDAFKNPVGDYHVIEFKQGNELRKIVVAAGEMERDATRRVLERYGIDKEFRFIPATPVVSTPLSPGQN